MVCFTSKLIYLDRHFLCFIKIITFIICQVTFLQSSVEQLAAFWNIRKEIHEGLSFLDWNLSFRVYSVTLWKKVFVFLWGFVSSPVSSTIPARALFCIRRYQYFLHREFYWFPTTEYLLSLCFSLYSRVVYYCRRDFLPAKIWGFHFSPMQLVFPPYTSDYVSPISRHFSDCAGILYKFFNVCLHVSMSKLQMSVNNFDISLCAVYINILADKYATFMFWQSQCRRT